MFKYMYSLPEYRRNLVSGLLGYDIGGLPISDVTLEPILSPDVQNDLGLAAGDTVLLLVEAQSTKPTNVALRMLEYATRTLMNRVDSNELLNIFGTKQIPLPAVRLYVVYTGRGSVPQVYKLSDPCQIATSIDVEVKVLSRFSLGIPQSLKEYIRFSEIVSEAIDAKLSGETLVNYLVSNCRAEGVLTDIINNHMEEVRDVLSVEERRELQRQKDRRMYMDEGREEGRKEGRKEGRAEGRAEERKEIMAALMENLGISEYKALELMGCSGGQQNPAKSKNTPGVKRLDFGV